VIVGRDAASRVARLRSYFQRSREARIGILRWRDAGLLVLSLPLLSQPRIMVRITTWNVNGIRNPFGYKPWSEKRTFDTMFDILETDIVIMQELKIQRKDLSDDMVLVPGWDCFFSLPKHKKGMHPS
jgi:hypothetical protein